MGIRNILERLALRILPAYNRGRVVPTRFNILLEKVIFYSRYGQWPNFKNPSTYFELINREKLLGNQKKLAGIGDKWAVRDLVEEKIGEKYLTSIIDVLDYDEKMDEARYSGYPKEFVAKPNMASKRIFINTDYDFELFRKEISSFFDEFGNRNNEFHYKLIPKKLLIEERLRPSEGELLELKCLVFNGRLELIAQSGNVYEREKSNSVKLRFYDRNWEEPPIQIRENLAEPISAPDSLDEIIACSEELSRGWPFIRVDWYLVDGSIKFGELTPIPRGGRSFNLNLEDHKFIYQNYYLPNL